MNRKQNPHHETETGDDLRPLVLLALGLMICIVGLLRVNFRPLWDKNFVDRCPAGVYVWLSAPENKNAGGVYCLHKSVETSSLYAALGLNPPPGLLADLHPPPLATILLQEEKAPVLSGLNPRLASFFFLPVPINRADREALMTVPGIGSKLADRIIRCRKDGGWFHNPDELSRVSGLGKVKISRFAGFFSFEEP